MALVTSDPPLPAGSTSPAGPEQGVIEEARRRQRQRYTRTAIRGLIGAALIGAIIWALGGGASHASTAHAGAGPRARVLYASDPHTPAFNERLYPYLMEVGRAGWCTVIEENGITGGSACGGVANPSNPFVMVQSSSVGGSHRSTTTVVAIPQVVTILVNGRRRVRTVPLPGLPYGLRGARIVTPVHEPVGSLPPQPMSPTLVPLNAQGHPIPQRRYANMPLQATVRSWHYPSRAPQGSCRLHVSGLPGLATRGGEVASAIRPFPGQLVGHAFLPCISTTYFLKGLPVKAMIVLDAANPRVRTAALPDFKPVPRAAGFFFEGGLTARRSGNAWLIVGQGDGLSERMRVLRHLIATVGL
jgi:hypothetical protein